jgi:CDP-glycerol glycerophosphotransferase (TagB/SpsB family)
MVIRNASIKGPIKERITSICIFFTAVMQLFLRSKDSVFDGAFPKMDNFFSSGVHKMKKMLIFAVLIFTKSMAP